MLIPTHRGRSLHRRSLLLLSILLIVGLFLQTVQGELVFNKSLITGVVENISVVNTTAYLTIRVSESESVESFENWLRPDDVVTGKALSYVYVRNDFTIGTEIKAYASYEGVDMNGSWFFYDIRPSGRVPPEPRLSPGFTTPVLLVGVLTALVVLVSRHRSRS